MMTSPRIAAETADESVEQAAGADDESDTLVLDGPACWRLLDREGVGRLAISADDGVDIFPLNYLSIHGRLYFRSAPGTKIVDLTQHPRVAFEVDGRTMLARWSVVVRGLVRRLGSEPEILRSGVQKLHTWQSGEKFNYFEIQPEQRHRALHPASRLISTGAFTFSSTSCSTEPIGGRTGSGDSGTEDEQGLVPRAVEQRFGGRSRRHPGSDHQIGVDLARPSRSPRRSPGRRGRSRSSWCSRSGAACTSSSSSPRESASTAAERPIAAAVLCRSTPATTPRRNLRSTSGMTATVHGATIAI